MSIMIEYYNQEKKVNNKVYILLLLFILCYKNNYCCDSLEMKGSFLFIQVDIQNDDLIKSTKFLVPIKTMNSCNNYFQMCDSLIRNMVYSKIFLVDMEDVINNIYSIPDKNRDSINEIVKLLDKYNILDLYNSNSLIQTSKGLKVQYTICDLAINYIRIHEIAKVTKRKLSDALKGIGAYINTDDAHFYIPTHISAR